MEFRLLELLLRLSQLCRGRASQELISRGPVLAIVPPYQSESRPSSAHRRTARLASLYSNKYVIDIHFNRFVHRGELIIVG